MSNVPESIRATATEIAEKLIPAPKVSDHVADWAEDERDLFRNTDWLSFTERGEALDRLRVHKAAVAVVDAVLPAVVAQVQADALEEAEQDMAMKFGRQVSWPGAFLRDRAAEYREKGENRHE